jgi:hypothetical protein
LWYYITKINLKTFNKISLSFLDQILRNPLVQKRLDFFKANGDENYENSLLQTIRVPKNLLFLTDRLPQANYEKIPTKKNLSFQNSSLPDVKVHKQKRESRNKERSEPVKNKDIVNQASADIGLVGNHKEKIERHSDLMEPQIKARNVVSLQPSRNPDDLELLKKKIRIKDDKSPEIVDRDASHGNIRVVKPSPSEDHHQEKNSDLLLPNLPNIKGSGAINYEIKYDASPRRK